jgi:hypothetical protein
MVTRIDRLARSIRDLQITPLAAATIGLGLRLA